MRLRAEDGPEIFFLQNEHAHGRAPDEFSSPLDRLLHLDSDGGELEIALTLLHLRGEPLHVFQFCEYRLGPPQRREPAASGVHRHLGRSKIINPEGDVFSSLGDGF